MERRTKAMCELSAKAFPEPEIVPDEAPTPMEAARAQRRNRAAATEAAAPLRRACAERAGMLPRETAARPSGKTA